MKAKTLEFALNATTDGSEAYIELNKLLKLMQLVESGAEANHLIDEGLVLLNGEVELRKRAKIRKGNVVKFGQVTIVIQ